MRHRYMLWAGHIFVFVLLFQGFRWLAADFQGMKAYGVFLSLAAMTVLVLNHCRWWSLTRKQEDEAILNKIDLLMVANYCILVLVLELVRFYR